MVLMSNNLNLENRTLEQLERIACKRFIDGDNLNYMFRALLKVYAEMPSSKEEPVKYARKQMAYYLSWKQKDKKDFEKEGHSQR